MERWSRERIAGQDPEQDAPLDESVLRDGWLGFAPARLDQVQAAEARLGRPLPPSLHEFLLVSDGWREAGPFVYLLAGTAGLDWLRDTDDAYWIEAWSEEAEDVEEGEVNDGEVLERSLRLSLDGDAAIMYLDPDDVDEKGEWAGYWLSSWSGMGPERHGSFRDLMYSQYVSFRDLGESETRDR